MWLEEYLVGSLKTWVILSWCDRFGEPRKKGQTMRKLLASKEFFPWTIKEANIALFSSEPCCKTNFKFQIFHMAVFPMASCLENCRENDSG